MNWVTLGQRIVFAMCLAGVLLVPGSLLGADGMAKTIDGTITATDAAAASPPQIEVTRSDQEGLDIGFAFEGAKLTRVKTKAGTFVNLDFPGSTVVGAVGTPAIPVVRRLIEVPIGAIVVASADSEPPVTIYGQAIADQAKVMPIQAPVPKIPGAREAAPFAMDQAAYTSLADYPQQRVTVEEIGIFRGHRLYALEVRPIAYNPATNRIDLYRKIDVNVRFGPSMTPVQRRLDMPGLQRFLLNDGAFQTAQSGSGNYLIVVASDYASAISSFATAKAAQGYNVDTYSVAGGTTNTAIKSYIESLWGTANAPDYVLLVGDTDKIPHWTGGGTGTPATDLNYTCMDGASDWAPDMAIGRFPADSVADVNNMVEKTLLFENGPLADPSYTGRAVYMASTDNYTVTEGTHNYCISTHMDTNDITSLKLYTQTYSATSQQVRDAFNAGQLWGVYSGHGGTYSWADGPPFYESDVNNLTNEGMYPLVLSFACVTGTYTVDDCFTEIWMLEEDGGAAAVWGSSVNSDWVEDDVLQRRLFDVFYDDYVREIGPAITLTRANFAAEMGTGDYTRRYFEMYNLMGDPSLYMPAATGGMGVSPSAGHTASGPAGGPFSPECATYDITNTSDSAISYTVTHSGAAWATLAGSTSGTLAASQTAQITLCVNANANALADGDYTDTITFTNNTDHVGDTTRVFTLEIGEYSFASTDVPKTISDNASVTSTLDISETFCIDDVDVAVDISHTYIGDLVIELTSPLGQTVTLHDRSGGSADDLQVTYDDEGTAPSGPGALSDFEGQSPAGTWTLTVTDEAGGDTGTVNAWSLIFMADGDCGDNDSCSSATVVCNGSFASSTTDATNDGASSCGSSTASEDRWYSYAPSANGTLTVSTCTASYDTVLAVHSGCPGTTANELACNDDDESTGGASVCGGGLVSSLAMSVTAGETYLIRVSGYNGAAGDYTLVVDGPACDGSDMVPPTPDPMTFEVPPTALDATSITMTGSLATDVDSPPVQYRFGFVSGGAGGTGCDWQSGRTYVDAGLSPNEEYTYRARAQDSADTPNPTSWSSELSVYTLAETPVAPTLSAATAGTINIDVLPGANSAATGYAIRCVGSVPADATWSMQYVNASGDPVSSQVWQTEAAWGTTTVTGLNPDTQYTFAVQARNGDSITTALGATSSLSTNECDVNADCADGLFCNGSETCDGYGVCQAGTDPCPGQACDEGADACFDEAGACCLPDGTCDDTLSEDACTMLLGTFDGVGTTCPTTPPCEPVDTIIWGELAQTTVAVGGTTSLEVFMSELTGMRGYQLALEITRLSGDGTLSISCPDGIAIDEGRSDYVFYGVGTPLNIVDCPGLALANALIEGTTDVGSAPAYLAEAVLEVSGDATVGSTFEVSFLMEGVVRTELSDEDAIPQPFRTGAPIIVTVGEVGACCLPDGSCDDTLGIYDCWDARGVFHGVGTSCPTTPPCEPVDAVLRCALDATTVPAGGTTAMHTFIDQISGVRGYQLSFEITRLSGTGDVSVTCPGGVVVDETRTDYIFDGQSGAFHVFDCPNLTVANALQAGSVDVGATDAYLGGLALEVSGDAETGSTFEISFVTGGLFGTEVTDEDAIPLPFNIAPSCVLTVGEVGACCLPDGTCDDTLAQDECWNQLGVFHGVGSTCPTTPPCEPVDATMWCDLGAATVPSGGATTMDVFLDQISGVRGYQLLFAITRLSGSGSVSITCPDGMAIEESRTDYIFEGQSATFPVLDCENLTLANALLSGTVDVGMAEAYLANLVLEVSADATDGSTFEIALVTEGVFGTEVTDEDALPMSFNLLPPCVLTVGAAGACCLPDGSCEALSEQECTDRMGEHRGLGTTCPPDPECVPVDTEISCALSRTELPPAGRGKFSAFVKNVTDLRGYQLYLQVQRLSGSGTLEIDCATDMLVNEDHSEYVFLDAGSTFLTTSCPEYLLVNALLDGSVNVGDVAGYLADLTFRVSEDATFGTQFEISFLIGGDFGTTLMDPDGYPIRFRLADPCILTVQPCDHDFDCLDGNVCTWDSCDEASGFCNESIDVVYGDITGPLFPSEPNSVVNLDDVLCALDAFGLTNLLNCPNADIHPCEGGNDIVNLSDILGVLNAFGAPLAPAAGYDCDCPLNG